MSEMAPEAAGTGTEQVDGQLPDGETPDGEGEDGGDPELIRLQGEVERWKQMSRKTEKQARENAAAARKLKELEDKDKTEQQKAEDRVRDAEQRADAAEQKHYRVMAAAMHDLPVELIDELGAGTEEEITARAELWAGLIENRAQELAQQYSGDRNGSGQRGNGRPVESMRAGAAPAGGATPTSTEDYFRALVNGDS